MRKYLLLMPVILSLVMVSGVCLAQRLIIKFNNGNETPEMLNSIQKLYFSGNSLMVDFKTGTDGSFQLADIRKLYFDSMVNVDDLYEGNDRAILLYPNPSGDYIFLRNIPEEVNLLNIYAADGQLVTRKMVTSENEMIDVTHLKRGLYLILMPGNTLKFIRK